MNSEKEQTIRQLTTQVSDLCLIVDSSLEKQSSNLITLIKTTNSKIKNEILLNLSQTFINQNNFNKQIKAKLITQEADLNTLKEIVKNQEKFNQETQAKYISQKADLKEIAKNQNNFIKEMQAKFLTQEAEIKDIKNYQKIIQETQTKYISQETDLKEIKSTLSFQETYMKDSHQNLNNQTQEIHRSQAINISKLDEKVDNKINDLNIKTLKILTKIQENSEQSQQNLKHDLETKFNETIKNIEKITYFQFVQQSFSFQKSFNNFLKIKNEIQVEINSQDTHRNQIQLSYYNLQNLQKLSLDSYIKNDLFLNNFDKLNIININQKSESKKMCPHLDLNSTLIYNDRETNEGEIEIFLSYLENFLENGSSKKRIQILERSNFCTSFNPSDHERGV